MIRRIPNLRQIKADYTDTHGSFEYGPLAPGYAITLGTALRRVLLSSVPGCGIYALRIDGISHEYTTIPGMREDVIHFIQNLKLISFQLSPGAELLEAVRITINASGPVEVTTDMIDCNKLVTIREKRYLCYLNEKTNLSCEIFLKQGEGYVEARSNKSTLQPGLILIDNVLNGVKRVSIDVEENVQYRDHTDYEILKLSVSTDGSVNPNKAIEVAVSILVEQLSRITSIQNSRIEGASNAEEVDPTFISRNLEEFNLPPGTVSALKEYGIENLGHLLSRTRDSLYEIPRVGARKISDIENILSSMGLSFKDPEKSSIKRKFSEEDGQAKRKKSTDKGGN